MNLDATLTNLFEGAASARTPRRRIEHRTRGHGYGPIARLMSPSDLGSTLKPFVFLDIFSADRRTMDAMTAGGGVPIHPHSGVATVTVFTEGNMRYDDPAAGTGVISYGGVEWMRAGGGVWHGHELSPGDVPHIQGFQLWLALTPELENGEPESRYFETEHIRQAGPARVIVGCYDEVESPVPAPAGINYLLVTLQVGERWIYQPPNAHSVGWLAVAKGALDAGEPIGSSEMVLFEHNEKPIVLEAVGSEPAVFVLGSARPHTYPLHLGAYSVHTSAEALVAGERRIAELGRRLKETGGLLTSSGMMPVYR
ncbi:pirin family protein [Paraburkholderia elongata]|uniref:Pirin family protein n=1 Tax=Paraburkholderia elongata TaxID=2675747 RepID=A0A972SKV6_9BURK|nr:pirin family protein [Paraburkholderia elongata]NPT57145.1 pirin family protein [Paraburkholderia elongata]